MSDLKDKVITKYCYNCFAHILLYLVNLRYKITFTVISKHEFKLGEIAHSYKNNQI